MIWLDSRERRSDGTRKPDDLASMIDLFHAHNLRTERKMLKFADIAFEGRGPRGPVAVGIERKTVTDLLGGRERFTSHQIPGLHDHYDYVYLVVQGVTRRNHQTGLLERLWHGRWYPVKIGASTVPFSTLDSTLWSIEHQGGCSVYRTSSDQNTVETIAGCLYRPWRKPWDSHSTFKNIYRPRSPIAQVASRPSLARQFASLLPGIGWKRSEDVARRFRTCKDVVEAQLDEWMSIPGIGDTTAARAYWAIRGGKQE